MILYHGSTAIIDKPRIITAEYGRDFSAGFYTTDIKEQAVRWARRKDKIETRKGITAKAVLSKYESDEKNYEHLRVIHFPEPSAEWLKLVCGCRSGIDYHHEWLPEKLPTIMWEKRSPLSYRGS